MTMMHYFSAHPARMGVFGFVIGALLGLAWALPGAQGPAHPPLTVSVQ